MGSLDRQEDKGSRSLRTDEEGEVHRTDTLAGFAKVKMKELKGIANHSEQAS